MERNHQKNILNYWKYICQFSPIAAQGNRHQNIRWEKGGYEYFKIDQFAEDYNSCKKEGHFLEVVCGNVEIRELYKILNLSEGDFVEKETGRSFIFTALYDEFGIYINKSFQVSNFFLLMLSLSKNKWNQLNDQISGEFNEKLDLWIQENSREFKPCMLTLLAGEVFNQLNLANDAIQKMKSVDYGLYIKRHKDNQNNQDDEYRTLEDGIIQMDFYSEELTMILEKGIEGSRILKKLLQREVSEKIKVDDNEQFIRDVTRPRNYPLAKWPSRYNPSLMQTVAINIATSENPEDILAVNGPPGTGKTTLLKEIIANNIFEKAKIISEIGVNSTTRKKISSAESYYQEYYQLPHELKKLGIVVASNNNAAVENITKDLPKGTDLYSENTFTEYFDNRNKDEVYFTESTKKLFEDEDVWGLISAPYGKSVNINKLKAVISTKHGAGNDVFSTTSDKNVDFNEAKKEFDITFEKVKCYQLELDQKVEEIFQLEKNIIKNASDTEKYYNTLKSYSEEEDGDQPVCIGSYFFTDFTNNEYAQVSSPWITSKWNKLREELFYKSLKLIKSYIQNAKGIKKNLSIFCAIRDNEQTGYTQEEKNKVFKECYHTLNLLIPVLSTTFASVKKAFADFGANELGMVIIDEAGQANPYSAAGLLYRAQRCIVVGDPLQVEPVVTIPETLNRLFFEKFNIQNIEKEFIVSVDGEVKRDYKHTALSIQTLADASSLYYGKIGEMEVGCPLVVHRRCEYPMFDISNKISYDNRMINKCIKDKNNQNSYVIQKSSFVDIYGKEKGEKNHYVTEQGVEVIRIINEAIAKGIDVFGNDKALYIISPFKTVINNLKDDLKSEYLDQQKINKETFNKWLNNALGTVHKFQGKEADSVIMILGCDSTSQGAANWAAQQANILNVAVTRAKRRVAIIGDKNLWKKQPYFEDAIAILDGVEK